MSRHLLIRGEDGDQLVAESRLPAELNLHDALAANPQLIPTADLDLGAVVVAGRESSLGGGFADLILLEESGQLCLVEVKKEGNPDTREVVAQLLDYAAGLWGQTLDEFTEKVVRPHLRRGGGDASVSLEKFVQTSFPGRGAPEPFDLDLVLRNLETTLQEGRFVLVVAAPEVPAGVERALDYLNAQGLRVYALEVGYFRGEVECFVPRVSVKPPPILRQRPTVTPITREAFLESLGNTVAPIVALAVDAIEETGVRIVWNSLGPTVKIDRATTRQIGAFEQKTMTITIKVPSGFPSEPFDRARQNLTTIGLGRPDKDGLYHRIRYDDTTPIQLQQLTDTLTELSRELTGRVDKDRG